MATEWIGAGILAVFVIGGFIAWIVLKDRPIKHEPTQVFKWVDGRKEWIDAVEQEQWNKNMAKARKELKRTNKD